MRTFRHKLREVLGLPNTEIVDEDGGGGGGGGGAGGGSGGGGGDGGGGEGSSGGEGGGSTGTGDTKPDNDYTYNSPFGFGSYWKGLLGKCPDGTRKDPNTGACKKK